MFNKKLKKDVQELRELVALLDTEVRLLLFEKERAKYPEKKLILPNINTEYTVGLSLDELRKKYRGSTPRIY